MTQEVPDRLGRTALHYAALEAPAEAVRNLIAAGADVTAVDEHGFTRCTSRAKSGDSL